MTKFLALLLCFFIALPACQAQRFVKVAGNTNEMLAQPVPDVHTVTLLKGYASSNENLNALFQYVRASAATPDGIRTFTPTFGGGIGRYHLLSMAVQYYTNVTIISTNATVIVTSNLVVVATNISFVTTNTTNLTWTFITPTATNIFNPTNLFTITNSVPGIGTSTDEALVRWDGATGRLIQNSVGLLTDGGALSGLTALTVGGGITNTPLTGTNFVFTDANKRLVSAGVGSGLAYDGTNVTSTGLGGTVTSVALTAPGEFTVTGSPITTSGTLAIAKANQVSNTFWAGPSSGADAPPAFRALHTNDIPTNLARVTSVAATAPAAGFTISGSPITSSGTFVFALADDLAGVEALALTGIAQRTAANTWATALGTANYVPKWSATAPFLTTTSLIYDNASSVGIGTIAPTANVKLHVLGINRSQAQIVGTITAESFDAMAIDLGGSLSFGGSWTGTSATDWVQLSGRKENAVDGDFSGYFAVGTRSFTLGHAERMRVTSAGLVGINTTTPGQRLSVNGGISLVGLLTNTSGNLQIGAVGGTVQIDPIVQVGVNGGTSGTLGINSAAATTRDLVYRSGGVQRWVLRANATAEGGATAGSDFEIIPADDAGAALATAVFIKRSTGGVSIAGPVTNGSLTASSAVFADANKRLVSTGLVTMAQGGTGVVLTDPLADKLFGWDDTANQLQFFNIGAGLVYDAATDTLSSTNVGVGGGDFVGPASATDTAIVLFDGTTGKLGKNSVGLLSAGGALTGITTLNTGNGANELFPMDQSVLTTFGPTFLTLNTGQGANELYGMDQHVTTTNNVTFSNVVATGSVNVTGGITNAALTLNSAVFTDANKRLVSTGLVALAQGGTANALADPASNRLMGWDDTDNLVKFLIIGAGLNYDAVSDTLTATTTGGDVVGPGAATDEAIARFDGTTGKLLQNSAATLTDAGAIAGVTTLNTGNGANELFAMDQPVRTTDPVVFATVNTGQGVNELYPMDQAVRTTDTPSFTGMTLLSPASLLSIGDFSVFPSGSSLIILDPAGTGYTSVRSPLEVTGGLTNATLTASNVVFTDANKRLISGAIGAGLSWNGTTLSGSTGSVASVAATAPAAGFTISGSPITGTGTFGFTLANDLAAVEGLSTTGMVMRTAADTWSTTVGTANYLPKWSATPPYLTTNSLLFDSGTAVGIGTVVPAYRLQVLGGPVAIGQLTNTSSANIAQLLLYASTDNADRRNWSIRPEATLPGTLGFSVSANNSTEATTQVMSISKEGNVGIGTTAPTALLSVAGTASITGAVTNASLTTSSAVFSDANKRLVSTGLVTLAQGGTATGLADPNANRVMGWDDTENLVKFFTIGTGLSYDQATDTLSAPAGGLTGAGTANAVPLWTGASTLSNSGITTDGSGITIASGGLEIGTSLQAGDGTGVARLVVDGSAIASRSLNFRTAASDRWQMRVTGSESGSNAGSDFTFARYDDSGVLIGTIFTVNRADGGIKFPNGLTNDTLSTSSPVFTDANKRLVSSGTVTVPNGGTGATTLTDSAVLLGNGTGAVQGASPGAAGQVLTSNGAGVDPSFQAAAAGGSPAGSDGEVQYSLAGAFAADSGFSFTNSPMATLRLGTAGTPGVLNIGNQPGLHSYSGGGTAYSSVFAGPSAGNFSMSTASFNTGIGASAMTSLTDGSFNSGVGYLALSSVSTGQRNSSLGYGAGDGISTGADNVLLGYATDTSSATGTNQTVIGSFAVGTANNTATIGGAGTFGQVLNVNAGQASALRARVGGTIHVDTTTVGNVGGGFDDLMTWPLPANTLSVNHDRLVVRCAGTFASNGNSKTLQFLAGTNLVFGIANAFDGFWRVELECVRTGATTHRWIGTFTPPFGSVITGVALYKDAIDPLSSDMTLKCNADSAGSASNDIVQTAFSVEWHPAP